MPVTPVGNITHQEANFGELLEPKLRKLFYESYDEIPEQFSGVFTVQTSKKAKETDYGMGAMSPWAEFGGLSAITSTNPMPTVPYAVISPAQERTYTHHEFAQGFMVERKFADDEMYNVIEKMPKDLARAGRYKVETDAAGMFNNGFAGGAGNYIYDSVYLFSDVHPIVATGTTPPGSKSTGAANDAGKTSNLITGALSDTKLKEAMVRMRQTVDEAGKLVQFRADTLIVPPQLEFLANELIQSNLKTGTADNDINTMKGRLKVVVLDFLSSSTAWFVMDSKRAQMNFFWRVRPEFKRDEDFDSLVAKYRGYMRYSYGVSDFRGIMGSTGV